MNATNATALRARLGETKAEFFTNVEMSGAADVSGTLTAGQLKSESIVQVGVTQPAGATVCRRHAPSDGQHLHLRRTPG
jgi:hypothetical protein